jgi:hypothetical protein
MVKWQPMSWWHIRRAAKSPHPSKFYVLRSHALSVYASRFGCSSDPAKGYDSFDEHDPLAVSDFKQSWRDFLEAKAFGENSSTAVYPLYLY